MKIYRTCPECNAYAERRMPVLIPAIAETRAKTGETAREVLDRYMDGVHERHLAGGSL